MAKTEFPKKGNRPLTEEFPDEEALLEPRGKPSAPASNLPAFLTSSKTMGIVKFLLGVLLLAYVYSFTVSFLKEIKVVDELWQWNFWMGVIAFVVFHFFIFETGLIYRSGQKIVSFVFTFVTPFVKVAPYLLPIYSIIFLILYAVFTSLSKSAAMAEVFTILFGFTLAMHIAYSAKTIRSRKGDFLKANYIFGFSVVYVINIITAAFCVNLLFEKFSFVGFCNNSFRIAWDIYYAVFKQLFIPPA